MKRSSLRDRMAHTLRQVEFPRGPRGKKLSEGLSRLPIKDLILFLESTGDEQVECAKRCLWKLSFNAPIFPPSILFRKILSLQGTEKAQDSGSSHRPRDHIRHLVYLVVLGVYVFAIDLDVQKRFERQATHQKRRHQLGPVGSVYQFIQSWISFCIFHDIGYPLERYHSTSDESVRESIKKDSLEIFADLKGSYVEEYSTRVLANLTSLVSLLDFEDQSFDHLVLAHLTVESIQKIKEACKTSNTENSSFSLTYARLRAARPIALFSPPYARLLGSIIGGQIVFAVLESEINGSIVWIGNLDRSVEILCEPAIASSLEAWGLAFGVGPKESDRLSVKYFPACSLSVQDLVSRVIPGEVAFSDIMQICKDLQDLEEFRRASKTTDHRTTALSEIAYGALCSAQFVDFSRSRRFEAIEPAVATRVVIENHVDDILSHLAKGFEKSLRKRVKDRVFSPSNTLITNPPSRAYSKLASEAIEFESILKIVRGSVTKLRSIDKDERPDLNALIGAIDKQFRSKSDVLDIVTKALEENVQPKIEENVRKAHAINRIFGTLLPQIRNIVDDASSSEEMASVQGLLSCDLTDRNFIRDLYLNRNFGRDSAFLTAPDRSLIELIGGEYDPVWHVDHGIYAAAMCLWSSTLRYSILKSYVDGQGLLTSDGRTSRNLACLMNFNPTSLGTRVNDDLHAIGSVTEMVYSAVALHNFYPAYSASHKHLKHKIGGNPFTYISLLLDALQNWDRDVQYDSGRYDLKEMKPDGFLDIFFESGRLCVVVNRNYFNEEKVIKLRRDISDYLCDVDAVVDIRVG